MKRIDVPFPDELKDKLDATAKRVGLPTSGVLVLLASLALGYEPNLQKACQLLAGAPLAEPAKPKPKRKRRASRRSAA